MSFLEQIKTHIHSYLIDICGHSNSEWTDIESYGISKIAVFKQNDELIIQISTTWCDNLVSIVEGLRDRLVLRLNQNFTIKIIQINPFQ